MDLDLLCNPSRLRERNIRDMNNINEKGVLSFLDSDKKTLESQFVAIASNSDLSYCTSEQIKEESDLSILTDLDEQDVHYLLKKISKLSERLTDALIIKSNVPYNKKKYHDDSIINEHRHCYTVLKIRDLGFSLKN